MKMGRAYNTKGSTF